MKCYACDGAGLVTCPVCQGDGDLGCCSECLGEGITTCEECDGGGEIGPGDDRDTIPEFDALGGV